MHFSFSVPFKNQISRAASKSYESNFKNLEAIFRTEISSLASRPILDSMGTPFLSPLRFLESQQKFLIESIFPISGFLGVTANGIVSCECVEKNAEIDSNLWRMYQVDAGVFALQNCSSSRFLGHSWPEGGVVCSATSARKWEHLKIQIYDSGDVSIIGIDWNFTFGGVWIQSKLNARHLVCGPSQSEAAIRFIFRKPDTQEELTPDAEIREPSGRLDSKEMRSNYFLIITLAVFSLLALWGFLRRESSTLFGIGTGP
jgi:hypothetical protein